MAKPKKRASPGGQAHCADAVVTSIRVPAAYYAWLEAVADQNLCSVSYVVLRLITGAADNWEQCCQMALPLPEGSIGAVQIAQERQAAVIAATDGLRDAASRREERCARVAAALSDAKIEVEDE